MAKEIAGEELDGRPGTVELPSEEEEPIQELLPETLRWGDDQGGGGVLGLRGDGDCASGEGRGGYIDRRGELKAGHLTNPLAHQVRRQAGTRLPGGGGRGSRRRGGQLRPRLAQQG
jgi:hypothetical protein